MARISWSRCSWTQSAPSFVTTNGVTALFTTFEFCALLPKATNDGTQKIGPFFRFYNRTCINFKKRFGLAQSHLITSIGADEQFQTLYLFVEHRFPFERWKDVKRHYCREILVLLRKTGPSMEYIDLVWQKVADSCAWSYLGHRLEGFSYTKIHPTVVISRKSSWTSSTRLKLVQTRTAY